MATNFQINFHRTKGRLHLKLDGDFDGSSAYELLIALKEHGVGFHHIFVDTNGLKTVYPFGRDVFQKSLWSFGKQFNKVRFIGENKNSIAPY